MMTCAIGTMAIIMIATVVLLIFGGKKIPELMKGLGQGVSQFKKGMKETTDDLTNDEVSGPSKEEIEYEKYKRRESLKQQIIREKESQESSQEDGV